MILQPSSVYLREYEEIFTGSNQEFGHLTPFLGFESDTAEQIFVADKITYFHYPNSAETVPLSTSGLVECGATPGSIPYRADKIWQKVANYKKNIWWGDSPKPQPGIWACAWLSGNSLQGATSAVWMNRFYNPGYIDSDTALFVTSPSAVYDEPSTMLFNPGVWYRYHHIGNNHNKGLVTSLSGITSALKVHIEDWDLPIIDQSPYQNTIVTEGDTSKMTYPVSVNKYRIGDNALHIRDKQEVNVLFNPSFKLNNDITVAFWAKATDWSNIKGHALVSHDHRGGWSFYYNNGFYNPTITIFSSAGSVLNCNANIKPLYTLTLPGTSDAVNCAIDKDLYTWVVDNGLYEGKKHLYKVDKDSNIDLFVEFSPTAELVDVKLDNNSNVWVLDSSTNNISSFDTFGNYLGYRQSSGSSLNRLDVDLNGQPSAFNCRDVFFDNNNIVVLANSTGLWSYSSYTTAQITDIDVQSIACDKFNNYWVMDHSNNCYKFTNGVVTLSSYLGDDNYLHNISLTNEYNNTKEAYEDYIWLVAESGEKIYKYNTSLSLQKVKNISNFDIAPVNRSFTSYDWNRKYNFIPIGEQPQLQTKAFFGTLKIPVCGENVLTAPATELNNNDWHHFAFTYEFNTGEFRYYIDTVLRDSLTVAPSTYLYYNYENNIFIGADAGAINSLDTELSYDKLHFTGYIDDFRVYNYALTVSDFTHIFLLKYDYKDIIWNMPTGVQPYIEEIERFFKYKLPGKKSQYYKIKLTGLNIQDQSLRWVIEDIIKNTVKKIAPIYTELYTIVWE